MSNPILPGILVFKFFDPTTETSTGSKHNKPDIFGKQEVHSTKRTQLESENHWFRHWPMRRQSQKGKSCFLRKTFFCSTFNKVWCEVAKPKASSIFSRGFTATTSNIGRHHLQNEFSQSFPNSGGELRRKQEQRAFHQAARTLASSL